VPWARPDHLRGEEAGQGLSGRVPAPGRDARGHGFAGTGEIAEGFHERDQFRGFEEDETAVSVVIGQAAESLAPDRDLWMFFVRPSDVEPRRHAAQ
jgi:hypothetical protein